MNIEHAIAQIDGMIESLQNKRVWLEMAQKMVDSLDEPAASQRVNRAKKAVVSRKSASASVAKPHKAVLKKPAHKKGQITPAGRKRIAEAQRKRWKKVHSSQPSVVSRKIPATPAVKPTKKKSGPEELKAFHATESAAPKAKAKAKRIRIRKPKVASRPISKSASQHEKPVEQLGATVLAGHPPTALDDDDVDSVAAERVKKILAEPEGAVEVVDVA